VEDSSDPPGTRGQMAARRRSSSSSSRRMGSRSMLIGESNNGLYDDTLFEDVAGLNGPAITAAAAAAGSDAPQHYLRALEPHHSSALLSQRQTRPQPGSGSTKPQPGSNSTRPQPDSGSSSSMPAASTLLRLWHYGSWLVTKAGDLVRCYDNLGEDLHDSHLLTGFKSTSSSAPQTKAWIKVWHLVLS
jgi:hypothetical protein